MKFASNCLPRALACAAMIAAGSLAAPAAADQPTATATLADQSIGGGIYQYDLTLNNTGDTAIGTYWFAWVPGEDFLSTIPTAIVAPANWTDSITHAPFGPDGYAIQYVANGSGLLAAGNSLTGFQFDSSMTPAQIAGNSIFFPTTPVTTSFVYSGGPFSDAGYQFTVSFPVTSSWSGGNSDNMWMVGDTMNWSTGVVPGNSAGTANADTALFNQDDGSFDPTMIQANLNIENITFDNSGGLLSTTITVGTTSGNPLILTSGGTIQVTSTVVTPQIINAPLTLEGNYTFTSNSTTSSATLGFGGAIMPDASLTSSPTTLTLNGSNTGANTISGVLSDNGSAQLAVAVGGTGVWVYCGATNTYSGGTTIAPGATLELAGSVATLTSSMNIANAGTLMICGNNQVVGTVTGSGNTAVNCGSLTAYQIRQNSLTIGSGATVTLLASGSGSTTTPAMPNNINFSSSLTSLSIANNGQPIGSGLMYYGTLDIGNNGLVIAYGSGADPYATINSMVEAGYNGGFWTSQPGSTGITSSLAGAGVAMHISTPLNIGLLDFTPGTGNYSNTTFIVFEGQTVTTNAILVRLTYMDDLVLAGDMSQNDATSDALLFAANYGVGTTWGVGDLVHDGGPVESSDALSFAANFATGLPSLDGTGGDAAMLGGNSSGQRPVPEPATMLLAATGALGLGLLARRRRGG